MPRDKPFSAACERNQQPIAEALGPYLQGPCRVLEVGSGTGQHAVYLATRFPEARWQPSELAEAVPGVEAWREDAGRDNLAPTLTLDINRLPWPVDSDYDLVFTANTVHFVGWPTVENLFDGVRQALREGGHFLVYGPFNDNGRYTSPGNEQLDAWLRQRDPASGIKDRSEVIERAAAAGLVFDRSHPMPANNQLLSFIRSDQ